MPSTYTICEQSFLERVFEDDRDLFSPRSWYSLEDAWGGQPTVRRKQEIAFRVQTGIKILLGLQECPDVNPVRVGAALDQLGAILRDHDVYRQHDDVYSLVCVSYDEGVRSLFRSG